MRRVVPLLLQVPLWGCGALDSVPLVVTATPQVAAVSAGGTLAMTGTQTGFIEHPYCAWGISESGAISSGHTCGKLDTEAKDFTGCPYGFVMYHDATTIPSTATYYAPSTPGTYHVIWDVAQLTYLEGWSEKWTIVTVTVTP